MHTLEEPLQILRIYLGRNPVAQVRNPAALFPKPLAHALHRPLNRLTSAIKQTGVHVTLQRDLAANDLARLRWVDAPVEPEDVVAGVLSEGAEGVVRALGEEGEWGDGDAGGGELLTDAGGDLGEGGLGEFGEVVGAELAGPRVEDLKKLRRRLTQSSV